MIIYNILTWTILKKIQISNGCETFAFTYTLVFNILSNIGSFQLR